MAFAFVMCVTVGRLSQYGTEKDQIRQHKNTEKSIIQSVQLQNFACLLGQVVGIV
jgi:hypothetical protein